MKRKLFLIIVLSFVLAGCWDQRELSKIALAT